MRECQQHKTLLCRAIQSVPKVSRLIFIALYYKPFISKALRYGPLVTRGPHSFTCHPHMNHTCLYSPAARCNRSLAGTHCAYPQDDGQAELYLSGWIHIEINVPHWELNPVTISHPSTNYIRHRVTSLIEANTLQRRQTTIICE